MKKCYTYLLLFFASFSFGQIGLEHTYNDGWITRVKFETWGEKYYLFKSATNELVFYNADHTWWKTIVLPAPAPTSFTHTRVFNISETEINPDSNLEIIFGYYNFDAPYFENKVISEDGTILLTVPDAVEVTLSKITGLPDKLIATNVLNNVICKVYSVPELILEHTYTEGNVSRINLENSGEKYYVLDAANGSAKVYNGDHTLWKTVNLPKPSNASYAEIDVVCEDQINSDGLLKIGYVYYISDINGHYQYTGKLVNENNAELLTIPEAMGIYISNIEGADDKLMATIRNPLTAYSSTNVYQLSSLFLEQAYESQMRRIALGNSGEKYYTISNLINNQAKVYNSDHSLWKTIALTIPGNYFQTITEVNCVSESKINADALIELSYTYFTDIFEIPSYETQIINENGTSFLTIPGANSAYISELPESAIKLIATIQVSDFDSSYSYNEVYSLAPLSTTQFENPTVVIAPNPAASFVTITSKVPIVEVSLYNMLGSNVNDQKDQNLSKINVENLPNGIYLLNLIDNNNQKSTHKIIISH